MNNYCPVCSEEVNVVKCVAWRTDPTALHLLCATSNKLLANSERTKPRTPQMTTPYFYRADWRFLFAVLLASLAAISIFGLWQPVSLGGVWLLWLSANHFLLGCWLLVKEEEFGVRRHYRYHSIT